jgi:hypothetical protein
MKKDTILEIASHGLRWTNNILVEISGNYSPHLPKKAVNHVRDAIESLHEALSAIASEQATPKVSGLDVKKGVHVGVGDRVLFEGEFRRVLTVAPGDQRHHCLLENPTFPGNVAVATSVEFEFEQEVQVRPKSSV